MASPTNIPSTTDPSALIASCLSGNPSVLASGQPSSGQNNKPTQIVNSYTQPIQDYRMKNGYRKGGFVRGYATGGTPVCANLAPPVSNTSVQLTCQPMGTMPTSTGINSQLSAAGVPTSASSAGANAQIANTMQTNAIKPTLPAGTQQTATLIKCTAGTRLKSCAAPTVNAQSVNAATVGCTALASTPNAINPAKYCATNATAPQMTAAHGAVCANAQITAPQINTNCSRFNINAAQQGVDPNAVVSNQIAQLTGCLKACQPAPAWAQPSINYTNAELAARGLQTSSIAAGAEVSALQQAALPVAQANAQYYQNLDYANLTNRQQATVQNAAIQAQLSGENLTVAEDAAKANASAFLQMNLQNLNNAQQAAVVNQQSAVQTMLSNQAADNAAKQFNAQSQNQVDEFMTNLATQVGLSNAAQLNAMNQFNAGQLNSVGEFNSQLANNVAQFNAQNQLAIAQSNVTWRRNINTLNTAAINAANQSNAQNLFSLTTTAQNNLWNQWQDMASWANTDSQNQLTRNQNMAIAALGQQTAFNLANQAQQTALLQLLGKFGIDVAGGPLSNLLCSALSHIGSGSCVNNCSHTIGSEGCTNDQGCDVLVCHDACNPPGTTNCNTTTIGTGNNTGTCTDNDTTGVACNNSGCTFCNGSLLCSNCTGCFFCP